MRYFLILFLADSISFYIPLDLIDGHTSRVLIKGPLSLISVHVGWLLIGQMDVKGRALAGFAGDADEAAMVFDGPFADGKAQAGSLAQDLSGEEGFEDYVQFVFRDAGPGIGYIQIQKGSVFVKRFSGGNGQGAAFRHGVDCIGHEIAQGANYLGPVEQQLRVGIQGFFQVNGILPEFISIHVQDFVNNDIDVMMFQFKLSIFGEGQYIHQDAFQPAHFRNNNIKVFFFSIVISVLLAHPPGEASDQGKGISDFVGHIGRKSAQGGELFNLNKFCLEFLLFMLGLVALDNACHGVSY